MLKPVGRSQTWVVSCTLVGFALFYVMDYSTDFQLIRRTLVAPWLPNNYASFFVTYVLIGLPAFLAVWLIYRSPNIFKPLGLSASLPRGLLIGFVLTLPSLIGHGLAAGWHTLPPAQLTRELVDGVGAGLFEELYFRGFLFGVLFRSTKAGFVPIILVTSAVFSAVHVTQAHSGAMELVGILSFTALGSALFAWLYVEWGYNLWVPISVHGLMDIWWSVFDAGHNAAGNLESDIPRVLVGILAIAITIRFKRSKGIPFEINSRTWWWKAIGPGNADTQVDPALAS